MLQAGPQLCAAEDSSPQPVIVPAASEAEAALVPPAAVVQCDGPFRHDRRWQGAGLAAPVFALRTRRSVGVGEFADIKQLADFGSAAGVLMHPLFTKFDVQPSSRDRCPS